MDVVKNFRLLDTLNLRSTDRPPIWIMRQAGRYLPEYRKIRNQAKSFMAMCKNPELACEITLLPIKRFSLDAAIIFSDILTIPEAMGQDLQFIENKGPVFSQPINNYNDLQQLSNHPLENLSYVTDAIKLVKQELNNNLPLIGFTGSPFTIASYMVEGQSSKDFSKIKRMRYRDPTLLHNLLQTLTTHIISFAKQQITAGINTFMLFDSWGGILGKEDYLEYSLFYMQQIVHELKKSFPNIPIIIFTKNGGKHLNHIAATGCNAIGIDWTIDLKDAKNTVGNKVALQGNLDPAVLYADVATIKQAATKILDQFGNQPGHIFNLGHGINPNTPIDSVYALIDAIHEHPYSSTLEV